MEKEREKICPLLSSDNPDAPFMKCQTNDCAWWNEYRQKCSVAIASMLPPKK